MDEQIEWESNMSDLMNPLYQPNIDSGEGYRYFDTKDRHDSHVTQLQFSTEMANIKNSLVAAMNALALTNNANYENVIRTMNNLSINRTTPAAVAPAVAVLDNPVAPVAPGVVLERLVEGPIKPGFKLPKVAKS
jgi:hypothetical protein